LSDSDATSLPEGGLRDGASRSNRRGTICISLEYSAMTLVSRIFSTSRQTTHTFESGPAGGPLMIFLHGWPGIGLMWRAQMDAFAADGWHCVAPDLRGYGGSSAPAANDAYMIKEVVADMAPRPYWRRACNLDRSRLGQRGGRCIGRTRA
jgi:predicted alpha/beta-fold hydrolase